MSDEPIDITPFVKSFDMTYKSGFKSEITDDENLRFLEHRPSIDINFELETSAPAHAIPFEAKQAMKMTQHGKYWFDYAFEADVIIKSIQMNLDGSCCTAEYEGMNLKDLTDRRPLARFLRWILRRGK